MQQLVLFCTIFTLSFKPQVLFNPSIEGPEITTFFKKKESVQLQD